MAGSNSGILYLWSSSRACYQRVILPLHNNICPPKNLGHQMKLMIQKHPIVSFGMRLGVAMKELSFSYITNTPTSSLITVASFPLIGKWSKIAFMIFLFISEKQGGV
jgi:hypothetical protein